ncbi:NAD(P)H-dependent FMN reductase [Erwinia tracheiphila PSU-1]|nr:NAD(P)H-dependent FMN reductase [Erwinia tracheiphila PSU-1]
MPANAGAAKRRGIPWSLYNFHPTDLLYARFDFPTLLVLRADPERADGLIIATPVYKASFYDTLKTLLPERALEHKVLLPLATRGASHICLQSIMP